jgi:L-alanine-DL-glutamate epimerase-like enolase superfamily enzyme
MLDIGSIALRFTVYSASQLSKSNQGVRMTVIVRVEAATATVPVPSAVGFSSRTVLQRDYTLVRVTGDDGVLGIGFCYPGHRSASLATTAVVDLLGPAILGRDAHLIEGAWQTMYQESLFHGRADR